MDPFDAERYLNNARDDARSRRDSSGECPHGIMCSGKTVPYCMDRFCPMRDEVPALWWHRLKLRFWGLDFQAGQHSWRPWK